MTHQATTNKWSFFSRMVERILFSVRQFRVSACFCFLYGRTDTMCENNDHLFGRGPVGQLQKYLLETYHQNDNFQNEVLHTSSLELGIPFRFLDKLTPEMHEAHDVDDGEHDGGQDQQTGQEVGKEDKRGDKYADEC